MSRPVRNKRLFGKKMTSNPSDDKVSRKISKLVREEDMDQDQAVAVAHSMKRRGEL